MGLETARTPKANGLKTAVDIVIAPKEALERLRAAPTWGWALLITIALYAIGSYLVTPALVHATTADWPRQVAANPGMAGMSPQQQQRALDLTIVIVRFSWVFAIVFTPIIMLVQALVMLLFKALGKGDATFGQLWASAVNIGVPTIGINAVFLAAIVLMRGPDSFNANIDVTTAIPSLGLLVPASMVKLHAFCSMINPFTLWSLGLVVATMLIVARVSKGWAWTTGLVLFIVGAALYTLGAK
jgi:hypothetical protein